METSKLYGEQKKLFDTTVFSKHHNLKLIHIILKTEAEGK